MATNLTIPTSPEVTIFDNQITLLYKWSNHLGLPVRYLVLPNQIEGAGLVEPVSLFALVQAFINQGLTLTELYPVIMENYRTTATTNDIVLVYFGLRAVGQSEEVQREIFQEINNFYNRDHVEDEDQQGREAEDQRDRSTEDQQGRGDGVDLVTPAPRPPTRDGFRDLQELQLSYQSWFNRVQQQLERDRQTLAGILDLQQTLNELPPLHVSPPEIDHVVVAVSPSFINGQVVQPTDGIDLFNQGLVSQNVPYLQYNDGVGGKFYKVYEGAPGEPTPNFSVVIPTTTQTSRKNTIYMTVWSGEGDIAKATKESFMRAVYSLETNRLIVGAPLRGRQGRDETLVLSRLAMVFPNLRLGPSSEVRVGGEFLVYDLEVNDIILFDMLLIQPLLNTYLYIEEFGKPSAEKRRPYIHYKSIAADTDLFDPEVVATLGKTDTAQAATLNASVSVALNQRYATEDNNIFTAQLQQGPTQFMMPPGTPYVHVNILRADNRALVNQFMLIFRRLLQFYKQNEGEIRQVYQSFIPLLTQIEQKEKTAILAGERPTAKLPAQRKGRGRGAVKGQTAQAITAAPTQEGAQDPGVGQGVTIQDGFVVPRPSGYKHKIEQLQDLAPDLFVSGYARKCQCPLQPIIIGPRDVDTWRNKTFIENGLPRQRQVMAFPRENSRWLFVCPSDTDPYPGVKENRTLTNREEYPFIPCCFKTDQMDPTANSRYNEYYLGLTRKVKSQPKVAHTIKTNKIPAPGRIGYVTRSIADLLKRYSEETVDVVRYGVIHSTNSLLHCLCIATQLPQYMGQNTIEGAELFVAQLRQQIALTVQAALLKQELYDYTDPEITQQLANNDRFLDPYLYYRALEETFGVNIYTFTIPREVGVTGATDREELGSIEVPRFRLFRVQPIRLDRPTVVILKHWGAESDNLAFPHCELLVDYDKDNETMVRIFGPEMTRLCHEALLNTQRAITWSFNETVDNIVARDNIYSKVDFPTLMQQAGLLASGQVLDRYGKLRALQYQVSIPGETGTQQQPLLVITLPGQPLNLPTFNVIQQEDLERFRIDATVVIQLLGAPTAKLSSHQNREEIIGLWFQLLDLPHALLIPVRTTDPALRELPEGPANPLISSKGRVSPAGNPIRRLRRLRRTADIILQLLVWLFLLKNRGQEVLVTAQAFINQYMAINPPPPNQDSAVYYDFSRLPRKLPEVASVEEAIQTLGPLVPTFFNQGRIVVPSLEMAQQLLGKLDEYQRNLLASDLMIPEEIQGMYREASDFITQPFTVILVGERDLQAWLKSLKRVGFRNVMIREQLDISYGLSDEPYLFMNADGKIYLIQNVLGGDRLRALGVTQEWTRSKKNPGYQGEPLDENETLPPHVVYGISTAATPIPIEDLSNGAEVFLQLLSYGSNRYAAMLPIL